MQFIIFDFADIVSAFHIEGLRLFLEMKNKKVSRMC